MKYINKKTKHPTEKQITELYNAIKKFRAKYAKYLIFPEKQNQKAKIITKIITSDNTKI